MYRRYPVAELMAHKTTFFSRFKAIMDRKNMPSAKQFLLALRKESPKTYFLTKSEPNIHIVFSDEDCRFFDDKEMLEIIVSYDQFDAFHTFIKDDKKIKKQDQQSKSQIAILTEHFQAGNYGTINGKPYLVYDIETTATAGDLRATKFYLGYSREPVGPKGTYRLFMPEDLDEFVQYMLDFDGYIVGYNNIGFDNPVSVFNSSRYQNDQAAIDTINAKSVDIFLLIQRLSKRRIGLNAVAKTFVGIEKTLESGAEGDTLMKKYRETGDETYLHTFQEYCKNDVRMTAMVLFYLLHYQEFIMDDVVCSFDQEMMTESYREKDMDLGSAVDDEGGLFV